MYYIKSNIYTALLYIFFLNREKNVPILPDKFPCKHIYFNGDDIERSVFHKYFILPASSNVKQN